MKYKIFMFILVGSLFLAGCSNQYDATKKEINNNFKKDVLSQLKEDDILEDKEIEKAAQNIVDNVKCEVKSINKEKDMGTRSIDCIVKNDSSFDFESLKIEAVCFDKDNKKVDISNNMAMGTYPIFKLEKKKSKEFKMILPKEAKDVEKVILKISKFTIAS